MEKEKRLKLFGVDIYAAAAEDENETIRKSKSLGDLQSCDGNKNQSGYSSDGALIEKSIRRTREERKRGKPWSEEEHRSFLIGLEQLGKGDWKGISRNFVPTRTPTQVASHAQKHFLRQSNRNKRRRRSSLFDVGINDNAAINQSEFPTEVLSHQIDTVPERTNVGNPLPMFFPQAKSPELEAPQTSSFLANYNCTQSTHSLMDTNMTCNSKFSSNAIYPNFLQLSLGN